MKAIDGIPEGYPMVTVQYLGQGAKASIVGLATRRNYGRKQRGDIFQVHRDDIQAVPELFQVLASPTEPPNTLPKVPEHIAAPPSIIEVPETKPMYPDDIALFPDDVREEVVATLDEPSPEVVSMQSFVETPRKRRRRKTRRE